MWCADRQFPVLQLSAESIESAFARADKIKAERIGIVQREIRSGYSGLYSDGNCGLKEPRRLSTLTAGTAAS